MSATTTSSLTRPVFASPISSAETNTAPGHAWNGRLVVTAGNDCTNCLSSIPNAISKFFSHAYADVRMFFRAFSSMGSGTGPREIERRTNEVTQFLTLIESLTNSASMNFNGVKSRYQRLSPQVQDLFFNVDQNYVNEFGRDPSKSQTMLEEMIRECQRVIRFQQQLTAVNTFYRLFSGRDPSPVTTEETTSTTSGSRVAPRPRRPIFEPGGIWGEEVPWGDLLGGFLGGRRGGDVIDAISTDRPRGASITHSFNLNIPGTVPYVQNAVPAEVQAKALQITNLRVQFAASAHPPPVPLIFNDTVTFEEFMSVPVFDASHPSVQNALSAAMAPGAASSAISALENRAIRHTLDKDSMEGVIRTNPNTAVCPSCRHHVRGMIRREFLRIDTALQDQILQFLTNAVAAGGSTTR